MSKPTNSARNRVSEGKVRPPEDPVDTPRVPTDANVKDDVAGKQIQPEANEAGGSTWADTALPAPNKKKARTHLF